eukprot:scpid97603/ scgid5286/ 
MKRPSSMAISCRFIFVLVMAWIAVQLASGQRRYCTLTPYLGRVTNGRKILGKEHNPSPQDGLARAWYPFTLTVSCNFGYHVTGRGGAARMAVMRCMEDGTWLGDSAGSLPTCSANTCPSLPPISNVISGAISVGARTEYHFNGSTLHITAAGYGDIVEFRCQDKPFPAGYVPRDGLRVDCLENGTWSSHSPSCNRELPTTPSPPSCPVQAFMLAVIPLSHRRSRLHFTDQAAPLSSPDVSSRPGSAKPFSNITLTCDVGYHVTGQGKDTYVAVSTCNESG